MKPYNELNRFKKKKLILKFYPGLYPPGAYIAWPKTETNTQEKDGVPFRRARAGGFIALPVGKQ